MQDEKQIQLSATEAAIVALTMIGLLSATMIGLGWLPQVSLILVLSALLVYGRWRKVSFRRMQETMAEGVLSGIGAIYLFFYIGLLVSALMMSGAIPTLMFYGFGWISPSVFYLSAFVLCSLVGVALGSGFTTCATVGVAFIAMSAAFGAELPIVAGAVVSGALFGDKMSPLSDTTTIAASIVGVDLFEHIRNMMFTTVPAWIISAGLFWWFSGNLNADASLQSITQMREALAASGLVHTYTLLPFALLLGLVIKRVPSIYAILATILLSVMLTYLHSKPSLAQIGAYFFDGYKPAETLDLGGVERLLSRGGMQSMFFSQMIVILALSLGGLLNGLGVLPALLNKVMYLINSAGRVTFAAAATAFGINVLVGEQYLSLLLTGNAFKSVYQRLQLSPRNLSRTIEDAGTVVNPLVPWSVYGVFLAGILGVSVLAYLPYAFFCYFSLLLTLIYGFTGITISKIAPTKQTA